MKRMTTVCQLTGKRVRQERGQYPVGAAVLQVDASLVDEEALAAAESHGDHGRVRSNIEECA